MNKKLILLNLFFLSRWVTKNCHTIDSVNLSPKDNEKEFVIRNVKPGIVPPLGKSTWKDGESTDIRHQQKVSLIFKPHPSFSELFV